MTPLTSSAQSSEVDPSPVLGTYSVSGFSDAASCVDPADEGIRTESGTANIDTLGSFRGTGVLASGVVFTVQGSLFSGGSVSLFIDWEEGAESGSLSGSGTFVNDTMSFTASGSSNLCSIVFVDMTLTRTAAGSATLIPSIEAGSEVTTQGELDAFTRTQPNANSMRTRTALRGADTGALALNDGFMLTGTAAGSGAGRAMGAWIGYSRTDSKNDFATTAMSSDRDSFLLGIDTMVADGWLAGVSFGVERTEINTRFNGGEESVTALTVAPYVGALLNDWLTFDASFGYSDVKIDQYRIDNRNPLLPVRVTSDLKSRRIFANANVSVTYAFGNLLATGQTGLLWASQRDDQFTESSGNPNPERKSSVGRWLLGGELAYSAGAWEPYVHGLFEYDVSRSDLKITNMKEDDTDFLMSLGLRYLGRNNLSGSLEYSKLFGRANIKEDTLSAQVRWAF